MFTDSEKLKIFKSYLGIFFKSIISDKEKLTLKKIYPEIQDCFVTGSRENLLKFGQYVLLNFNKRQKYKFILAYDIIFNFFEEGNIQESSNPDQESDQMGWFDTAVPLYFVLYLNNTPKNKMLDPALSYFVQNRKLQGKTTIILSELRDIPEVTSQFDMDERLNIFSLNSTLINSEKIIKELPKQEKENLEQEESIPDDSMFKSESPKTDTSFQNNVLRSKKANKKQWKN